MGGGMYLWFLKEAWIYSVSLSWHIFFAFVGVDSSAASHVYAFGKFPWQGRNGHVSSRSFVKGADIGSFFVCVYGCQMSDRLHLFMIPSLFWG